MSERDGYDARAPHVDPMEIGVFEGLKHYTAALARTDRGRWAITVSLILSVIDIQVNGTYGGMVGEHQFGLSILLSIVMAVAFLVMLDMADVITGRWDDE